MPAGFFFGLKEYKNNKRFSFLEVVNLLEEIVIIESIEEIAAILRNIVSQEKLNAFIAPDFQSGLKKINQIDGLLNKQAEEMSDKIANRADDYLKIMENLKEKAFGDEFAVLSKATLNKDFKLQKKIIKTLIGRNYTVLTSLFPASTKSALNLTLINKLKKLYALLPDKVNEKYKKEIQAVILLLAAKKISPPLGLYIQVQCSSKCIPCMMICQEPYNQAVKGIINLINLSQKSPDDAISKKNIKKLFFTLLKTKEQAWREFIIDRENRYDDGIVEEVFPLLKELLY